MLEINPLAVDRAGNIHLVGTMMEVDDNALFRHGEWLGLPAARSETDKPLNERERSVIDADRRLPGGAIRYTELDGDIGLLVAGGGAGLLQHDMIVDLGGRPANHTDVSPTPTPEKPEALFDAIFSNPRTRGLLVGYNYLQMAPCDRVAEALISSARKHKIDATKFPIVVRLFGPAEERAREMVASLPGVNYLPSGAPLADGVRAIVKAMNELPAYEAAQ
jgi:succinyl-CoA synthetase beta subunit/citryl-CoA synthetase large subunit